MEIGRINQGGTGNLNLTNKPAENTTATPVVKTNTSAEKVSSPVSNEEIKEVDLKKAVDKLNKFLEDGSTHAEYEAYDKFRATIIKIVDDNTKEIIMEIPSRKVLDMVAKMCELVGVLVDEKA